MIPNGKQIIDEKKVCSALVTLILAILMMLCFFLAWIFVPQADAQLQPAYTDEAIVNAIWHSEGGAKTKYPYGIRSVYCDGEKDCRKVCFNTVRNNRRRYEDYGHKDYGTYIEFLASRYAPTQGKDLTKAEKRLNQNWIKNVLYFLEAKP